MGGAAFLPGRGTGTFSSLLVGVKSGKGLKYVGRVGGGFDAQERAEWHERSKKLAQKESPFDNHPEKRPGEIWHWMKPELVIQVAFADWTHGGILRQPRYLGLRQDRDPKTVVREEPAHTEDVVKETKPAPKKRKATPEPRTRRFPLHSARLTHPERVLFPHDGITKLQLAEYFAAVGEHAMPHYHERPSEHPAQHAWIEAVLPEAFPRGVERGTSRRADSERRQGSGLRGLRFARRAAASRAGGRGGAAQLGRRDAKAQRRRTGSPSISIPAPSSPIHPARSGAGGPQALQDLGLESWVKTTGGKGLHVVVPLAAPQTRLGIAKEFSRSVTLFMERLAPTIFTSKTGERNRKNKIFIDYLRNGFGATAVAAFSPRWRPGVGVSTPVAWDEIDEDIRGTHFNLHNVPARVAKQRKDPWKGYWTAKQSLTKAMIKKMGSGPVS